MAANITAGGGSPPALPWVEDQDGNSFIEAVLSVDTTYGQAGFVLYTEKGAEFFPDTSLTVAVVDILPAVNVESGSAGDMVRVQVYGMVEANFSKAYTIPKGNLIKPGAAVITFSGSVVGNLRWGITRGSTTTSKVVVNLFGVMLTG